MLSYMYVASEGNVTQFENSSMPLLLLPLPLKAADQRVEAAVEAHATRSLIFQLSHRMSAKPQFVCIQFLHDEQLQRSSNVLLSEKKDLLLTTQSQISWKLQEPASEFVFI